MSSYPPRSGVDAYRASPVQHRHNGGGLSGGGGGGGRAAAASWRNADSGDQGKAQHGVEVYGLEHAVGLPGFEGGVAAATLAPAHGPAPAPPAAYLALLCHEALADFKAEAAWAPEVVPAVETALRVLAMQLTPHDREQWLRLQAMGRLKELAQSGIQFCQGLDLEPYGSFVSGLYTPTGDLDLSIEGHATWQDEAGRVVRVTVDGMEREMKVRFLRALASRIQAKRLCRGQVERILHARVPILKFRDISGLDFDVGIGGSHALFKSAVLGLLGQFEWRFGALVRLVKLWARQQGVNDSANGTFNSFALTLMVVFHLQTRSPPVLPPLCSLFGSTPGGERPMQEGRFPDWHLLTAACDRLGAMSRQGGPAGGGNSETLLELLASFFALYEGVFSAGWAPTKGADAEALRCVLRRVRVDTWGARLRHERWDKEGYCCSVEDPFDSTDNCARTLRHEGKVAGMAAAFGDARRCLLDLQQPHHAEYALVTIFGTAAAHVGAYGHRSLGDLLRSNGATPAVQWVCPTGLIIPPRIQAYTDCRLPPPVRVNHQRRRGPVGRAASMDEVQQQIAALTLRPIAVHAGLQHGQQGASPLAAPLPPPGLGLSPVVPGLAPGVAAPGTEAAVAAAAAAAAAADAFAATQQAQGDGQAAATAVSLMGLRHLMEPEVGAEAARLAELAAKAAQAAAATAEKREERKAAKRAAAKASRDAKAEERRRTAAERGGGSRSRSSRRGSRSSSRRSSAVRALSPRAAAAGGGAPAAVSNLGRAGSMASSNGAASAALSASAPAPPATAAAVEAATVHDAAAAAQQGGSASSDSGTPDSRLLHERSSDMAAAPVKSYSLWAMPRGPLADRLGSEIRALAAATPGAPPFAPHVTLLGGIRTTEADVLARAKRLAAELKPYRVAFDRVSSGAVFHQCVYLLCRQEAETMAAGAATRATFNQDPASRYMPHLSLLYSDIDQPERELVAAEQQQRLFGEGGMLTGGERDGFEVTSLTVWEMEESDRSLASWRQLADYPLGQ
ncbi:poly(A) RNA polymerase GLD2 [Micractinium conductrix]|uniref:Poly(A) RNA polymerase GLD2 n=1 Tax=Micractinium conductrix TaxID=554055 RepID=A0A2P6V0J5_9CHLO|nr:poly(A) RNA polymerase GLD2 [Micractinium conductrix]|eukprot:PSC67618.1 poly(A) RNA polymerase GLD2 [Micractinium conductrix]